MEQEAEYTFTTVEFDVSAIDGRDGDNAASRVLVLPDGADPNGIGGLFGFGFHSQLGLGMA
ncbi:hypothetical protein IHN63_08940 [Deinococcus sp. 6YEL10]|uniref:hypothetical protein n=1 Tax=Deinococcus sp. 6YEL10 TaxID=2745870 RepID=UPI001E44B42C|nr:hypothetical protein [Deinococcus sp. 6YEL10]MCD0161431.1 hypothetical protein [Deinococcus sp. 6YEL10]